MTLLEGDTLGEKHKNFNKLVQDAVSNNKLVLTKLNHKAGDIHNLVKIDAAGKTRNVDLIVDVYKSDDMLYVSRAIKQSTWLITEPEYAHIIHPDYLHYELFPHMLTKAINKLLLHIRLHLKDEKRVESFYRYIRDQESNYDAEKWLLNCSVPFVISTIQKESHISLQVYKRLCKRSVNFLQYFTKVGTTNDPSTLGAVVFLIKSHTEEYLRTLERNRQFSVPKLGKKNTEIVMKKCPQLILDNFEKFMKSVNLSVVAKHLDPEATELFLLKYMEMDSTREFFCNHNNTKSFVLKLSEESRRDMLKTLYFDWYKMNCRMPAYGTGSKDISSIVFESVYWYQFAQFKTALSKLKKFILTESSPARRCIMLTVLIKSAKEDPKDINTALQYYYNRHRHELPQYRSQYVKNVITETNTHEFQRDAWNILNKLFESLEVYTEKDNDDQDILKSIVLYNTLHDKAVPNVIEKKFTFDTYKTFQGKLNNEQQTKLFDYLLSFISGKIKNNVISNESEFNDSVKTLKNAFSLLIDWKKDINEFPFVLDNVRKLLRMKELNSWASTEFASLYNMNKSWRKYMFEESIKICPSEDTCLNALKYKPQLLARHRDEIKSIRVNSSVSLTRFLAKLRIYWPHTLAQEWTDEYVTHMQENVDHKPIIKSLFVLLSKNQVIDLAKKYTPENTTIDKNNVDRIELDVRQNIARYLYTARPLVSLEVALWYAKGDYIKYTTPSINAIMYNLNSSQRRNNISKLLKSPGLQKYGLRLAFYSLEDDEFKQLVAYLWQSNKNPEMRSYLFMYTYNLICRVTDPVLANELLELLNEVIDSLTKNKHVMVINKLHDGDSVHSSIQGSLFKKVYKFLDSPLNSKCEKVKMDLLKFMPNIMHLLESNFVVDIVLSPVKEKIEKFGNQFINIISSYVLHGKTEPDQCRRYSKALMPTLGHIISSWELCVENKNVMSDRFDLLIQTITRDFRKFISLRKITIPILLFVKIRTFLDRNLFERSYVRCLTWKLTTEYVKLISKHRNILNDRKLDNLCLTRFRNNELPHNAERVWEKLHLKISPHLCAVIKRHLKNDISIHTSAVISIYSDALITMFSNLALKRSLMMLETVKGLIINSNCESSFLLACYLITHIDYGNDERPKLMEIKTILSGHPSREVKFYYKKAFSNKQDLLDPE